MILSTCISMPELSHTFFMAFVLSTFHKFSLSLSLSPPVPPMVPLRFPLDEIRGFRAQTFLSQEPCKRLKENVMDMIIVHSRYRGCSWYASNCIVCYPLAPRELASIGLPVCLSRFPPGSPNTYNLRKNRNDKNTFLYRYIRVN